MSKLSVNELTDETGSGAPSFPNGMSVTGAALTDPEITGGVYLGGTGSANYLDDYEEGTWTPGFLTTGTDFTSVSVDSDNTVGQYTKIGDTVYITGVIRANVDVGSATGQVAINGLPFNVSSLTNRPVVSLAEQGRFGPWNTTPSSGSIIGSSKIGLYKQPTLGGTHDVLLPSNVKSNITNSNFIMFSGQYKTNA